MRNNIKPISIGLESEGTPPVGHSQGFRASIIISAGFTLFEIIVAIFIFSLLLTAVFTAFRSISDSAEALQREDAYYKSGYTALSRMVRDINSIFVCPAATYRPSGLNTTPDPYRVVGELSSIAGEDFSKLRFTSFEHLPMNGDDSEGIAQLAYYATRNGSDPVLLRRSDRLWPYRAVEESANDPVLCEKVKSIKFIFHDGTGQTFDHWDSDATDFDHTTPRAIEIKLEIGDKSGVVTLNAVVTLPVYRKKKGDG